MSPATVNCSASVQQPAALMRQALQRAAIKDVADPEGLATLSHELKTPLVALLGFVQLMEADMRQPLSHTQRQRAEEIERAGRQMLDMVTTLLGQARRGEWAAVAMAQ
jgi:signal transduction histidine kinase